MAPRDAARGVLLVHGGVEATVGWAEKGILPVTVVPHEHGWTAVVPTGPLSAAKRPYDEAVTVLLNRTVPHRLRPAVGVGVVGRRAVLAVTPGAWRAVRRWLVWQPFHGIVHPGGLPVARLADVVAAAEVADPAALGELADVLHDPAGDAGAVAREMLEVLGLPGGAYLDGSTIAADVYGASVVAPVAKTVRQFDKAVHDDVRWHDEVRDEMEGRQR